MLREDVAALESSRDARRASRRSRYELPVDADDADVAAVAVELAALLGVDLVALLLPLLAAALVLGLLLSASDSDSDSELVSSSVLDSDSAFFLSAAPLVLLLGLLCKKRLTNGFFSGVACAATVDSRCVE